MENTDEKPDVLNESEENAGNESSDTNTITETVKIAPKSILEEGNIKDNEELYENEDDTSVTVMYLTVSSGNEADGSNHTWQEVNTYSSEYYRDLGIDRYKVEGILQIDEEGDGLDENSYGYGEEVPNVSVQVRGQTSSRNEIKNYKIRIKDGKEEYHEQRTLNLNKHIGDPYRFVNKMSYDLLDTIPQLMSARTQFVHLYVKDLTAENSDQYVDYGLYTMVEQINRTYLKNHKLDENGQLYKVTFFEWDKYDAVMMDPEDPEFDRAEFERYIEIKGDEDPQKIQNIVNKIHNYNIPIDEIIEEHFDTENLCYWMAFNLMIGNNDVGARNLYLYSPLNSEKFYFICWDMDASFKRTYTEWRGRSSDMSWEDGISKFYGLTLVRRMMKEEKYRKMLEDAVDDIYANYVNHDTVSQRVEMYKGVTLQYLYTYHESEDGTVDDVWTYNMLTSGIPDEVDRNYMIFKESLNNPWPFFVDMPMKNEEGTEITLNWGVSYDVNDQEVTYDLILARDFLFTDIVDEQKDLNVPSYTIDMLEPGTYYLRVVSKNESGYTMECFDYISASGYGKIYGCYCFTVDEKGKIEFYEEEE